ncbi:MAG: COX15/CtaA family protein [Phycisphaerae bacterium]
MGLHRLAIAAAVVTLLLIFVGGSVTSNDAGMAFADWPTVDGHNMFLFPPSKWVGDKLFEHVHRLLGAAAGMLMIAIAVWAQMREPRRQVRILAWIMLGAVIVQGVMGGIRVTANSITLAIVHGCLAQSFFCVTICMVLLTSRWWGAVQAETHGFESVGLQKAPPGLGRLCVAASLIVFGQLLAGAIYRHLGVGLAFHVGGAVVVILVLSWLMFWVSGNPPIAIRGIGPRLVKLMALLLMVQLSLGVGAYVSIMEYDASRPATLIEWLIPSFHVAVGAAILAVTVALTVSVYHVGRARGMNPAARALPFDRLESLSHRGCDDSGPEVSTI